MGSGRRVRPDKLKKLRDALWVEMLLKDAKSYETMKEKLARKR